MTKFGKGREAASHVYLHGKQGNLVIKNQMVKLLNSLTYLQTHFAFTGLYCPGTKPTESGLFPFLQRISFSINQFAAWEQEHEC